MTQTPIHRDQWPAFAQQFSRQHRGWLISVDVINSRELRSQPDEADARGDLLLEEVALKEVAIDEDEAASEFRVVVGEGGNAITHRVAEPVEVQFETTDDGAHRGLRVDAADGTTTLLRFRTPARPEVLDGISETEL